MLDQISGISPAGLVAAGVILLMLLGTFGQIAKKAGYSRYWALLLVFPGFNVVLIWVFSFLKWPSRENA